MISVSYNYCFLTLGSLVYRANTPCIIQNAEKHSAWCIVRWSNILLQKGGTLSPHHSPLCHAPEDHNVNISRTDNWRDGWICYGFRVEVYFTILIVCLIIFPAEYGGINASKVVWHPTFPMRTLKSSPDLETRKAVMSYWWQCQVKTTPVSYIDC